MTIQSVVELAKGFMFVAIGVAALLAAWSMNTKELGAGITRNLITGELCDYAQCMARE